MSRNFTCSQAAFGEKFPARQARCVVAQRILNPTRALARLVSRAMSPLRRHLALAALCVCCSAPSAAQSHAVTVRGRVVDESGAPIAGASVEISSETSHGTALVTDANGAFVVTVPASRAVRLAASHPDYGLQYTDMFWNAWSRYDVPAPSVLLTLRRGVVLRGQLVDARGSPRANERLLLVFDYEGSGPFPLETTTDGAGEFAFPRAVLNGFELVAQSLSHWHPETQLQPGAYLRVVARHDEWLARARLDQPVIVTVEPFTLLPVTLVATTSAGVRLAGADVDLWVRHGPIEYVGTMPHTDASGRCATLMEPGVVYELWIDRNHGARIAPWTQSIAPRWQGSVDAATTLTLAIP